VSSDICRLENEKIASSVVSDMARRLRRGVRYFQNIVWFHETSVGLNIILFTPVRNVQPHLRQLS
jgi:hypothetical protein